MRKKHILVALLVTLVVLLVAGTAYAQATGFDLSWWSVDGGGGTSAGGGYSLSGAIGQPDAGAMSGGGFTLSGGLWAGSTAIVTPPAPPAGNRLYLPMLVK